jgi:predicted DNA-binding transcriptional regulator AlpA
MSNHSKDASRKKETGVRQLHPPCIETPEVCLERKFFDSTTPQQMSLGSRALQPDLIDTSVAILKRKLLDIEELEQIYGLKHWTIRTWCSQRRIPHIKIGRRVYFDVDAIDAWIREHARPVQEMNIS